MRKRAGSNPVTRIPSPEPDSVSGFQGFFNTRVSKSRIQEESLHIVNTAHLRDGKVDIDSLEAISFDPYTHGYYKVGGRVGEAFRDGLKLK